MTPLVTSLVNDDGSVNVTIYRGDQSLGARLDIQPDGRGNVFAIGRDGEVIGAVFDYNDHTAAAIFRDGSIYAGLRLANNQLFTVSYDAPSGQQTALVPTQQNKDPNHE